MYSITVFTFVFTFCCIANAQQGPCTGGRECISVLKCPVLSDLLNKPNRSQQELDTLRKAHCGFDGQVPAVCCPGSDEPEPAPADLCYTPAGEPGKCISLYSCPQLTNLLTTNPVPAHKIQYISNSKCNGPDQYSVCCGPVPELDNLQKIRGKCQSKLSSFPPDPRSECCGVDGFAGNKIYGGSPTGVDQYPWLALIEYMDKGIVKTLCGGALISSKYVLTAAHCVTGQVLTIGTPSAVRLGEYNTTNTGPDCAPSEGGGEDCTEGTVTIPIERTIPHPQYNAGNAQNRNDIALIRMTRFADYTDFIRPLCLPTVDMTLRTTPFNLTAAGWGAVSVTQSSSSVKLHVDLPYVPISQCQGSYQAPGRRVTLWKGQLCAGGVKGKDSCKGDSGGPLMFENGRSFEVIGVVSFGPTPCGMENIPGVYTNVYEYNTWIRTNIVP